MNPSIRTARSRTLTAAVGALFAISGCGNDDPAPRPFDLGPGDATVCRAAATGNARTVYNTRTRATNTDLKTQVKKIHPGSTDAADKAAIAQIVRICTDHGFNTDTP